jgi:adenosylcobyric acid synthase
LPVPEEDALGWDGWHRCTPHRSDRLVVGIVDLPAISNFTDFEALAGEPDVEIVRLSQVIDRAFDAVIFPGAKHTVRALQFVREQRLDELAHRVLAAGGTVGGICGGYQLMGRTIRDPEHLESSHDEVDGLGLLPIDTTFSAPKIVEQVSGLHRESGQNIVGYQLRMGRIVVAEEAPPLFQVRMSGAFEPQSEGISLQGGRLFGTSLHGIFDQGAFRRSWLNGLRRKNGWSAVSVTEQASLDTRLDRLADMVERDLDMSMLDRLIEAGV